MSRRKCAAPWPQPATGGLRNTCFTRETTRANQFPRRIANGSLLKTNANRLTAIAQDDHTDDRRPDVGRRQMAAEGEEHEGEDRAGRAS